MINTYKESSLHRTLKQLYSMEEGSQTEVKMDGHIYDILTKDHNVIEIQTQNLGKLKNKILDAVSKGRKCRIVHPIVISKWIELYDGNNQLISKRKAPVKESIYTLFKELKGIYPLLAQKNFSLEVILIHMTECRTRTPEPVQTENGRRRFKRNWLKTDKKLKEIIEKRTFERPQDYLKLLPHGLKKEFTTKEIQAELKNTKELPASAASYAALITWTFCKAELISKIGNKNRSYLYKINPEYLPSEAYGFFSKP